MSLPETLISVGSYFLFITAELLILFVFVSLLLVGGLQTYISREKMQQIARFALTIFRQMLPYLLLGAGIGACIYGFLPADWVLAAAGPDNLFAIPIAALIGIPLYIRAETILPIAIVLLEKGMNTGAVAALLIGGAGMSIPEITMLSQYLKRNLSEYL